MTDNASGVALARLRHIAPGVALAVLLAVGAKGAVAVSSAWARVPLPVSPVLCAILLGLFWRNVVGVPSRVEPGLGWAMKLLLVGIALVGFRLTLSGMTEVAAVAVPVVIGCICAALLVGLVVSRALGIPDRLGQLLAVGTAVCGCTAVAALSPVIRARNHETAFAMASVVSFGCLGMLLQPWIAHQHLRTTGWRPFLAGAVLAAAVAVTGISLTLAMQALTTP